MRFLQVRTHGKRFIQRCKQVRNIKALPSMPKQFRLKFRQPNGQSRTTQQRSARILQQQFQQSSGQLQVLQQQPTIHQPRPLTRDTKDRTTMYRHRGYNFNQQDTCCRQRSIHICKQLSLHTTSFNQQRTNVISCTPFQHNHQQRHFVQDQLTN